MSYRYSTTRTPDGYRAFPIPLSNERFIFGSGRIAQACQRLPGLAIPLRRRRPHEPSSRPPCRPSPRAVEASWHDGRIRNGSASSGGKDREARRALPSFNDTILHFTHAYNIPGIYIPGIYMFCFNHPCFSG